MIRAKFLKDFIHGRPLPNGMHVIEETEWSEDIRQVKTVVIKVSGEYQDEIDYFSYNFRRIKSLIGNSYVYSIDSYQDDEFVDCQELNM